jgi:hypothetical protein
LWHPRGVTTWFHFSRGHGKGNSSGLQGLFALRVGQVTGFMSKVIFEGGLTASANNCHFSA